MNHRFFSILLLLSMFFLISSCTEESNEGELKINLTQEVDGKDLILNEWIYEAPVGHPYKVRRLQYLLSDFYLENTEGEQHKFDMEHFHEFGRMDTRSFTLDNIPPGTYSKIGFVFGLNAEKNLDNAFPDDYDMIAFKWPSQLGVGYHYMRFEVTADSMKSGVIKDFNLHTGATHGNQNFLEFVLQMDEMVIDNNSFTLDLVMDLNEWLQDPEMYDFEEYGFGIMGNQEAQLKLKANGKDVFSVEGPIVESNYLK